MLSRDPEPVEWTATDRRDASASLGVAFDAVLGAATAGAPWAWERLYASLSPSLLGYLRARGTPEPEDVLGEVWVNIARQLQQFEGDEAGLRSWAFSIAHRRSVDAVRYWARRPVRTEAEPIVAAAPTDEPEALVVGSAAVHDAVELLGVLTEEQREVLLLRMFGDLSIREVASITGRPEGAVKSLQHRALAALRRHLEAAPYPEPAERR